MDALKVGVSGVITGLGEGFESRLHKGANAAAENGLLAEEVGFGFGAEGGFKPACAGAADTEGIGKTDVESVAGGASCSTATRQGTPCRARYSLLTVLAGTLGGDHDDVDVLGRLNAAEMNAVTHKCKGLALGHVGPRWTLYRAWPAFRR